MLSHRHVSITRIECPAQTLFLDLIPSVNITRRKAQCCSYVQVGKWGIMMLSIICLPIVLVVLDFGTPDALFEHVDIIAALTIVLSAPSLFALCM